MYDHRSLYQTWWRLRDVIFISLSISIMGYWLVSITPLGNRQSRRCILRLHICRHRHYLYFRVAHILGSRLTMRKPTWVPGIKWLWKPSDRLDIWFQHKFNLNPKQRALELKMDTLPNQRTTKALDQALNITNETENKNKNKVNRKKRTGWAHHRPRDSFRETQCAWRDKRPSDENDRLPLSRIQPRWN